MFSAWCPVCQASAVLAGRRCWVALRAILVRSPSRGPLAGSASVCIVSCWCPAVPRSGWCSAHSSVAWSWCSRHPAMLLSARHAIYSTCVLLQPLCSLHHASLHWMLLCALSVPSASSLTGPSCTTSPSSSRTPISSVGPCLQPGDARPPGASDSACV